MPILRPALAFMRFREGLVGGGAVFEKTDGEDAINTIYGAGVFFAALGGCLAAEESLHRNAPVNTMFPGEGVAKQSHRKPIQLSA